MAAYGALVSLMHIIDRLEKHPSPPISIDKQQVESLTQNVTFLQEFLDGYISPVVDEHEADPLERRITDAVYAAEDVIESQIVLQIKNQSTIIGRSPVATTKEDFYHDLQLVIERMNLIKKEAMEIAAAAQQQRKNFLDGHIPPVVHDPVYAAEDVIGSQSVLQIEGECDQEMNVINKEAMDIAAAAQLQRKVSSTHAASSSTIKESKMVGFKEVLLEVLDKLTGGQLSSQIIPIMGMGGIGKTTLALHVFQHALVKQHFDICAWTTISQSYNVRETLREILFQASGDPNCDLRENQLGQKSQISEDELGKISLSEEQKSRSEDKLGKKLLSEGELGLKLYQFLWRRRYLIIMDDIWSIEVWDKIRSSFPDCNDGSRIIVTTRLSNFTSQLGESYGVGMKFLDEASSWDLFTNTVFGGESFPPELENIGKKIVANCKGLPLSIATIGGLLAKSERTREYWVRIEQNLNSIVIKNNSEFCLKILRMSYTYLPNYLKPCFLYMGIFEEDRRIRVSQLKKLWVSEGFLKPVSGKCLETIAEEYLKELVDRNMILVDKLGFNGNVKFCKMHDLLREVCLKEVEKERFYHILKQFPLEIYSKPRRVVLKPNLYYQIRCGQLPMFSTLLVSRSLSHQNLRLLRIFKSYDGDMYGGFDSRWRHGFSFLDNVFQLVNSRHLAVTLDWECKFPSSIKSLWNLNTLIVHYSWGRNDVINAPIEIWKLHQLRHLMFVEGRLILPDPPSEMVIMENLQTLKGVHNLYLNAEVVKRIPNVKKLHLFYKFNEMESLSELKQMERAVNCLSYLQCLIKLENLSCRVDDGYDEYLQRISFPHSLKKLKLSLSTSDHLDLVDILEKIGWLPLLQKLVLYGGAFKTGKWDTIEGQFGSLKLLQLERCEGLKNWTMAESSHFPLLQELHLEGLKELEEIPSEVGEIATLKSISMEECSESAVESAKKIVEEQEYLQGDQLDLHVRAKVHIEHGRLQRLASPNFEVTFIIWKNNIVRDFVRLSQDFF